MDRFRHSAGTGCGRCLSYRCDRNRIRCESGRLPRCWLLAYRFGCEVSGGSQHGRAVGSRCGPPSYQRAKVRGCCHGRGGCCFIRRPASGVRVQARMPTRRTRTYENLNLPRPNETPKPNQRLRDKHRRAVGLLTFRRESLRFIVTASCVLSRKGGAVKQPSEGHLWWSSCFSAYVIGRDDLDVRRRVWA